MILAGTDDGIYRWFEGSPWLTFHSLQGRPIVDLASPGGGVIAALDAAGRVLETENSGQSWRVLPLPEGVSKITSLALATDLMAILVATRPLGLYLRPVGAPVPAEPKWYESLLARARPRGSSIPAGSGVATAVSPTTKDSDSGWIKLSLPDAQPRPLAPEIRQLVRVGTTWFAAITGNGLWQSRDGGQTWNSCPGLPVEVYNLRAVPGQRDMLLAATSDGCWISPDGGQTWNEQSDGLAAAKHVRVVEARPDNPRHLLAGCAPAQGRTAATQGLGYALYESKDGGKTWNQVTKGFPVKLQYDTINDIRWDPAAPGFGIIALGSGECWRTRSGGDWWEPIARQTRATRALCATL